MKAGVVKVEPEQVPEVDPCSDRVCCLTVGKSFGKLHDGHQSQAPGCFAGLPNLWEEMSEHVVVEDGAELIS